MVHPFWYWWSIVMSEVQQVCVGVLTMSIALVATTFLFIANLTCETMTSLEPNYLLIDKNTLLHPTLLCSFLDLIYQWLYLPKWIVCLLLLGISPKVKHTT